MHSSNRPLLGKRSSFSNFSTVSEQPNVDTSGGGSGGGAYGSGTGEIHHHIGTKQQRNQAAGAKGRSSLGGAGNMSSSFSHPNLYNTMNNVAVASSPQTTAGHGASASISGGIYFAEQYLPRRPAYFESHWPLYACDWASSEWSGRELMALGTYTEDAHNRIQVVEVHRSGELVLENTCDEPVQYPATKVAWEPQPGFGSNGTVRLLSTSDCLRLWEYDPAGRKLQQRSALLNKSSKSADAMPPLTSFDWNKIDPSLVITSSIDTTCTIWDLNTQSARTQLIAHDNEVYDVAFTAGSVDIFASAGADGSVRVFDLRSLDHSTIIYEPQMPVPLVRVATSPHDRNVLATIAANSNKVIILDVRSPGTPLMTLDAHTRNVNCVKWAPSKPHVLATGGDDCQVLMWDLSSSGEKLSSTYTDSTEVNNVTWETSGDWLGIVSGRGIQGVMI
ncbi:hypothetical protein TRVA0_005S00276 [Trichomonascus vanleenenianus]|uniref:uncharacterized protein n=1 Tax=Trichomonascus vanleenenianus TaxID=2268995 RepID=UPI003EC9BEBA